MLVLEASRQSILNFRIGFLSSIGGRCFRFLDKGPSLLQVMLWPDAFVVALPTNASVMALLSHHNHLLQSFPQQPPSKGRPPLPSWPKCLQNKAEASFFAYFFLPFKKAASFDHFEAREREKKNTTKIGRAFFWLKHAPPSPVSSKTLPARWAEKEALATKSFPGTFSFVIIFAAFAKKSPPEDFLQCCCHWFGTFCRESKPRNLLFGSEFLVIITNYLRQTLFICIEHFL